MRGFYQKQEWLEQVPFGVKTLLYFKIDLLRAVCSINTSVILRWNIPVVISNKSKYCNQSIQHFI
jgi:hypothetical protein